MDPERNLREQRAVRARLLAAFDAADPVTGDWHPDLDDVHRLAELSEGLDGWLSQQGLPLRVRREEDESPLDWKLFGPI